MAGFKSHIDKFFLEEQNPYTNKKKIKILNIGIFLTGIIIIIIGLSYFLEQRKAGPKSNATKSLENDSNNQSKRSWATNSKGSSSDNNYVSASRGYRNKQQKNSLQKRRYKSSQIIEVKDGVYNQFLPRGYTIRVNLLNKVNSSDKDSPVIAVLNKSIKKEGETLIPKLSKFIGEGGLNNYSGRFCVSFKAVVLPNGTDHDLNGVAVMPDGSSCITGKYNSGSLKKHTSQFLGDFASGLADGMKSKTTNDKGIPFNKGGLKNGLLNGFSKSSSKWANSTANQYGDVRPKVNINSGRPFLIFLQQRLDL